MKCPECGALTHVLNTRDQVRRQRECVGRDKHRFWTEEVTKEEMTSHRHKTFLLLEFGRLLRGNMK